MTRRHGVGKHHYSPGYPLFYVEAEACSPGCCVSRRPRLQAWHPRVQHLCQYIAYPAEQIIICPNSPPFPEIIWPVFHSSVTSLARICLPFRRGSHDTEGRRAVKSQYELYLVCNVSILSYCLRLSIHPTSSSVPVRLAQVGVYLFFTKSLHP